MRQATKDVLVDGVGVHTVVLGPADPEFQDSVRSFKTLDHAAGDHLDLSQRRSKGVGFADRSIQPPSPMRFDRFEAAGHVRSESIGTSAAPPGEHIPQFEVPGGRGGGPDQEIEVGRSSLGGRAMMENGRQVTHGADSTLGGGKNWRAGGGSADVV